MIDITKSESKVVFSPYNDSYEPGFEDMLRRVPDLSKIKSFIDWDPSFKLDQIIQDVANSVS